MSSLSSKKRAIGYKNTLPWRIPDDLKRFKKLTSNHAVIMGRKTYDSIGHALPNRINIVLTRDKNWKAQNCLVVHSLEEALKMARKKEKQEIFIIGGAEIFKQSMDIADKLYLTVVEDEPMADTFFPDYSNFKKITFEEEHVWNKTEPNLKYKYIDLEK